MNKYQKIFCLSFFYTLKNYKALVGLSLFMITCLLIFAHLWKVMAVGLETFALSSEKLLWYIAFNEWLLVSLPDVEEEIEDDLRSGKLAYLLPRPFSYLIATFCEAFGILCANFLVLGAVCFSFTYLQTKTFPLQAFPSLVLTSVLAGCVVILFKMIIGLSSFWFHKISPFIWMWEKLLFTLGGLLLPLMIYPKWLQTISNYTPFPAVLGGRSALVIDFQPLNVLWIFSSLAFWIAFSLVCLVFLYRKGLRIINIEGG